MVQCEAVALAVQVAGCRLPRAEGDVPVVSRRVEESRRRKRGVVDKKELEVDECLTIGR
jgi:hypothetical protein